MLIGGNTAEGGHDSFHDIKGKRIREQKKDDLKIEKRSILPPS